MKKDITRRDFLNGTQVAIGATLLTPWIASCGVAEPLIKNSQFTLDKDYYPPARSGLRGSHDGSWENMQ